MFEKVVADLLNKHLGKYVQNLDTQNLKVGIFNGEVELTDLQLRPEALFELDLPIEVKSGYIGRIKLNIPWSSIYTSPVVAVLEDVYILAGPVADRKYDPDRERALQHARKKARLAELDSITAQNSAADKEDNSGFMVKLIATIMNNIQISIQRIHIRYEDRVTNPEHPFACGIMLKLLTAETTNNQWQPITLDSTASLVHKLVKLHDMSIYWNTLLPESCLVSAKLQTHAWRNLLKNSINTHRIMEEDLDFILRPVAANLKLIINKDEDSALPRFTLDFILGDIEVLISRLQFLNALSLSDSLNMMDVNQRYRRYSPGVPLHGNAAKWWHYAYRAVVEESIRPYSWNRIKKHRDKYRQYKALYKRYLAEPNASNISADLEALEDHLDIATIVIAREHAKLEYAQEAPTKVTRKKSNTGWLSWWFGNTNEDDVDEEDEGEVFINRSTNLPEWLDSLTAEERSVLFKHIGYDEKRNIEVQPQYVAHKVTMNLKSFTMSLVNYSKEVMKLTITHVIANLDHRPASDGFRVSLKTDTFIIEGVTVEQDLVPFITSDIGVYAPSITNQVFSVEFEKNPIHVQADYSAVVKIQPVEILYDEHALTEVVAFFQMPHISADDVKNKAQEGLSKFAAFSRAGLQYAIEQHKTIHLSVHMKSPYVVIPEFGTLHRGGNVLVVDFGKLKVESELQPQFLSLEDLTMSEIESCLYDKFNISVSDVKALLADSGDDWHTAQTKQDSEFHILPSFGMNLAIFNTAKPEYTQLPRQKIEARLSTLKLNLSDEKILMLSDFYKHMPMPHSNSMMGLDDSVDGHIEPILPIMTSLIYDSYEEVSTFDYHIKHFIDLNDDKDVQIEPSARELRQIRLSVHKNSVRRSKPQKTKSQHSHQSAESEAYYTAPEASDEETDEWSHGLDVAAVDDHTSPTNFVEVLGRFTLGEVVIHISKSADKIDTQYLMLRIERVCVDVALTTYGMAIQASLGGVEIVDKIHLGTSGEYMELLGSKRDSHLITFKYRKVEPECPEFKDRYHGVEQGLIASLSSLRMVFDRTAVLYLNNFIQGLMINIHGGMGEYNLRKSTSTVLSGPTTGAAPHPEPPSFIDRLKSEDANASHTKFHLVAKLSDLDVKLCDHENEFAELHVKGIETCVILKPKRTTFQARLTDLAIEDLTENTLYTKVLTIEDDNAFDFKMVNFLDSVPVIGPEKRASVDGSIHLRLGRVHGVFLYKFISEIQNFLEPFTNPDLLDSYKMAAQQAVHSKIQDVQEQGTRISLYLDIHAPTILVPQHSESTNIMVVKFGDLSVKNYFEDSEIGGGVLQHWDHMYLNLDSVQVIRGKLTINGNVEHCHTIIEPMSFKTDLKRALPPYHSELHYDVIGEMKVIKAHLTEVDLKVLMATLRQNLQEVSNKPEKVDESDLTPMTDRPIVEQLSLDTTTPVVEIEEPLLAAPEVMELVRQTKAQFIMEGLVLTLLTEREETDDADVVSLMSKDEPEENGEGLAKFEIGQLTIGGTLSSEGMLQLHCTLQSVSMVDIRPHSTLAIKKMVQSSSPGLMISENPPMVSVEYRYSADGNKQVDVNIETLRLNVCVEYLLEIKRFITQAVNTPVKSHSGQLSPTSPQQPVPKAFPSPKQPVEMPITEQYSRSAKVLGKFKQLEIVLFADPSERHSRVIVLKANGSCDYFCLQEREHLECRIKQLHIVSCLYGLAKQTASMVLYPCDLEFSRDKESADSELKMEARVSDIYLNLSATNLHIMLDVMDKIHKDRPTPVPVHDDVYSTVQHYDLWTTQKISPEPWLQPEIDTSDNNHFPLVSPCDISESLHIDVKKVQVLFEVENLDCHVPRLCLKTSLEAELKDWSKQLYGQAEIQVEASYYNEKLAVWEPLIENIMENEGNYRPWEVIIKCVQGTSHSLSCMDIDCYMDHDDEVDNDIHQLMTKARAKSDSSETETDSETEMTIIKPKLIHKPRHGSHSSYDSMTHPSSSIQGESDSEPELISTISSNLDSMFTSDSSDADFSEAEDDIFDNSDKPVFLTAKGPVHLEMEKESGYDETDDDDEMTNRCMYWLIDSHDELLINLTPSAMDIIKEVSETLMRKNTSTLKSIHDLPAFEIYNQLDVPVTVSLSHDLMNITVENHWAIPKAPLVVFSQTSQVYKENLHNVSTASIPKPRPPDELDNTATLVDIDIDEDSVDGLSFLSKALASTAHTLVSSAAFVYGEEEEDQYYIANHELGIEKMHIKIGSFDEIYNVSHRKAITKLITLAPCRNDTNYCMVYNVDIKHGRKVVTFKSPLQLVNHLLMPIKLFVKTEELEQYSPAEDYTKSKDDPHYILLKIIDPEEHYSIPLLLAYHCKLYVEPTAYGYDKSSQPLWWQDLSVAKDRARFYSCMPNDRDIKHPFFFKVVCTDGHVTRSSSNLPKVIPHYTLLIYPPVVLHNLLPYDVHFSLEGYDSDTLSHGESIQIYKADLAGTPRLCLKVPDYLGTDWSGFLDLTFDLEEFKAVSMESEINIEGQNKQLSLGVHVSRKHCLDLYVYSPYWIVNKTGLPVQLRGSRSDAVYESDTNSEPVLFRFKKHRRKKAKLKVYNSKWTHSFSLDTVGSHGVVVCHDRERNRKFQFLLHIQMSSLHLTKIVTILPYFIVRNKTSQPLRFMEENEQADLWIDINVDECIPYWPSTDSMKMYVKYHNSNVTSQHFYIHQPHITTLRMDKGTALCVEVSGGMESSITITFLPYQHGDAPVRIENLCEDVFIKLHQKNQSQVSLLSPCQSVLYTWDDPTAERTLMWNVYNRKKPSYPAFITKDGCGEVQLSIQTVRRSSMLRTGSKSEPISPPPRSSHEDSSDDDDSENEHNNAPVTLLRSTRTDKVIVYWISYLDGLQRVLLFTQDERVARRAKKEPIRPTYYTENKMMEAELADSAVFLSLSGIGLSLINSLAEEVGFVSLASSAALWEVEVRNKWKTLNMELASLLEQKWMHDEKSVVLEDYLQADLEKMEMKKPFIGSLRRTYNPALWLQYRMSKHHTYIHAKVHRLQVDNQLKDAYFTTVFSPVPLPSYVIKKYGPRPLVEFALMRRHIPERHIDTLKYVKLIMQEFSLKLDKGFILSMLDIFNETMCMKNEVSSMNAKQMRELLQDDLSKMLMLLDELTSSHISKRVVFEYLHLSPLKMHISFSLDGRYHRTVEADTTFRNDFINFFLTSVGASLTEIRDVEIRMAYFERQGVLLSFDQLKEEAISHYKTQAIQQAYVFILGLDVLGNPYGLVKDFTQGLGDLFYEPFLGTINTPDRFAESLVQSIHHVMEHTIGNVAGAVSQVTGSLGRTLARLSFDEDYKKRRRIRMNRRPRNLPETLEIASKGFVMGVALGLSGIVMSPVRGVQEEGVEGFFKGIGKGLMGLLTKPIGGVIDMISLAFDGVRRAAEMGEDVIVRMRPPRYIHPGLGIKPYSRYQAIGMRILYNLENGKYSTTDIYWAHAALSRDDRADVALVTNKRLLLLTKCRIWGDWDVEWDTPLDDMIGVPAVTEDRLVFKVKKDETGFSIFTSDEREIQCSDKEVLLWLQRKIERVMSLD